MRLIDTDVLIEMLRRGERIDGFISVITLLEFLRGVPEGEREIVKDLLERFFPVIRLDNDVVEGYCRLYRDLRERGEENSSRTRTSSSGPRPWPRVWNS